MPEIKWMHMCVLVLTAFAIRNETFLRFQKKILKLMFFCLFFSLTTNPIEDCQQMPGSVFSQDGSNADKMLQHRTSVQSARTKLFLPLK